MTSFNSYYRMELKLVLWSLKNSKGGEIFVKNTKHQSYDLAKAIDGSMQN